MHSREIASYLSYHLSSIIYHRAMLKGMCVLLIIVAAGWAKQPKARPAFNTFGVTKVFTGSPAVPKLSRAQRTFRTMIREGAKSHVQFAGHYTVPLWGCGSGCGTFVIVDSITGTVFDGFSVSELPATWMEKHPEQERMEFHPKSRLLKMNGCIHEKNCGFYDYEMIEGKGLRLIRKELLPQEFQ